MDSYIMWNKFAKSRQVIDINHNNFIHFIFAMKIKDPHSDKGEEKVPANE